MNYKKKVGEFGEKIAQEYLIKKGYEILGNNIKTGYLELDIIAKNKGFFVFVEVKTRTSDKHGIAEDAVGRKKLRNLKKAIMFYMRDRKINSNFIRLDLIAIEIQKQRKIANIKHYIDIF